MLGTRQFTMRAEVRPAPVRSSQPPHLMRAPTGHHLPRHPAWLVFVSVGTETPTSSPAKARVGGLTHDAIRTKKAARKSLRSAGLFFWGIATR